MICHQTQPCHCKKLCVYRHQTISFSFDWRCVCVHRHIGVSDAVFTTQRTHCTMLSSYSSRFISLPLALFRRISQQTNRMFGSRLWTRTLYYNITTQIELWTKQIWCAVLLLWLLAFVWWWRFSGDATAPTHFHIGASRKNTNTHSHPLNQPTVCETKKKISICCFGSVCIRVYVLANLSIDSNTA